MNDILKEVLKIYRRYIADRNTVVLLTHLMKPRIAKIGYALILKGFNVVLIINKSHIHEIKNTEQKFYTKVISFDNKLELLYKCMMFKPLAYHLFCEGGAADFDWASYIISQKKYLGKIVYDQYDVYRGIITERYDSLAQKEKFCMENADGLCCRMFETQILKYKYKYRFKGKRLMFLDYCWNLYNLDLYRSDEENVAIKLVYGGKIRKRNLQNRERYRVQTLGVRYIARILEEKGGKFILIPTESYTAASYSLYRFFKKKWRCIHIEEPKTFSELIRYESYMDYGIDCLELKRDYIVPSTYDIDNEFMQLVKDKYYATNKYFDYLDAGIMPIYCKKNELFGRYLERCGGAIFCPLEKLADNMENLVKRKNENKICASKARERFSILKQIDRLIQFYKEI